MLARGRRARRRRNRKTRESHGMQSARRLASQLARGVMAAYTEASARATFHARELVTTLTTSPGEKPALDASLHFGHRFSDHMLVCDWKDGEGWGAPRIQALRPFSVHPAAQTLQYGAHCFEGMKAYAGPDGALVRQSWSSRLPACSAAHTMLALRHRRPPPVPARAEHGALPALRGAPVTASVHRLGHETSRRSGAP